MSTAYFERFTLELTPEQARQGSHQGACDADIAELLTLPEISSQLDAIDPAEIAKELQGYGAWNDAELQDADQNRARILWIACGDINTEGKSEGRPVGTPSRDELIKAILAIDPDLYDEGDLFHDACEILGWETTWTFFEHELYEATDDDLIAMYTQVMSMTAPAVDDEETE